LRVRVIVFNTTFNNSSVISKQIAEIRTDDITVEIDISKEYHRVPWKWLIVNKVLMNNNPIINIVHMENWMNVMECLKDFLIIEEIVMATISKIITKSIAINNDIDLPC
jgi:S-adenosylmethionine:tRNA-ribosyltransferase-isomerase (queuine synthetase)